MDGSSQQWPKAGVDGRQRPNGWPAGYFGATISAAAQAGSRCLKACCIRCRVTDRSKARRARERGASTPVLSVSRAQPIRYHHHDTARQTLLQHKCTLWLQHHRLTDRSCALVGRIGLLCSYPAFRQGWYQRCPLLRSARWLGRDDVVGRAAHNVEECLYSGRYAGEGGQKRGGAPSLSIL